MTVEPRGRLRPAPRVRAVLLVTSAVVSEALTALVKHEVDGGRGDSWL